MSTTQKLVKNCDDHSDRDSSNFVCSSPIDNSPKKLQINLPSFSECSQLENTHHRASTSDSNQSLNESFDRELEQKAEKNNLTATNVKSILKTVFCNEHVSNMFSRIVNDETLQAIDFEDFTRFTRSKARAQQNEHNCGNKTIDFLDEEEDDDDEYKPTEDEDDADDITEPDDECKSELDESRDSTFTEQSEDDLISKRTRSKYHIEVDPGDTLQLPDVTGDLYCNENDEIDEDWKHFLNSLYDDNAIKVTDEEIEENNDPEYDAFQDLEDLYDEWDYRDDKAVKVSTKELTLLAEENSFDSFGFDAEIVKAEEIFLPDQIKFLFKQLHQHVQLLAQHYIQCANSSTLVNFAEESKTMLNELNNKAKRKRSTLFRTSNLYPAVNLLNNLPKTHNSKIRYQSTWRPLSLPHYCREKFIQNTNIFLFVYLLPHVGFSDIGKEKKTIFTFAEDYLIASALDQIGIQTKNCYKQIRDLLLPAKTVEQIRIHIKNLKRRKDDYADNPICYYFLHGKLLPTDHNFPQISPKWYQKLDNGQKFVHSVSYRNEFMKNKLRSPLKQASSTIVKKYRRLPQKIIRPIMSKMYLCPSQEQQVFVSNNTSLLFIPPEPASSCQVIYNAQSEPKGRAEEISDTIESAVEDQNFEDDDNRMIEEEIVTKRNGCDVIIKEHPNIDDERDSTIMIDDDNGSEHNANDSFESNVDFTDELNKVNSSNEEDDIIEFDDESDLAALMAASSTISNANINKTISSRKEIRKLIAAKHRESTLYLLSKDWLKHDPDSEKKSEILVNYMLNKASENFLPGDYTEFLSVLTKFDEIRKTAGLSDSSLKELYLQVEETLKKAQNAEEMIDQFVLFLDARQATICGRIFDFLYWERFKSFMRKVEVYNTSFDNNCLQRLVKALNQLSQNEQNVDKKRLKATVNRVFNGQPYLMQEFSSLFLGDKPNDHLFLNEEDFDEINIDEELEDSKRDFGNFNLSLTEQEKKYGTTECSCKLCHRDSDLPPTRHCVPCGIKYVHGKICLVAGPKKLQFAEVDVENNEGIVQERNNFLVNQSLDSCEIDSDCDKGDFSEDRPLHVSHTQWTMDDDRMLLELCQSKVIENENASLDSLTFDEASQKLCRSKQSVQKRFNQLMEMFNNSKALSDFEDTDI